MAQIFSLKNSKFFSGLKKICAIVPPITTNMRLTIRYIRGCSKILRLVFGVFIILCMCDKNEGSVEPLRLRECVFSFTRSLVAHQ